MNFSRKNHEHHKINRYFVSNYQINIRFIFLCVFSVFIFNTTSNSLFAQETKKNKVRLNIQYVKIMGGEIYFDVKASSKVKKKNIKVPNIELTLYNELEDDKIELGKTTTNMDGKSRIILKSLNEISSDSSNIYNILVSFKGNESYKKAKKSISFQDAQIKAKLITKDSTNYITATLIDSETKNPIVDESLTVQVQRLINPLRIGEEFNNTDDEGSILVPIEEGIPGVDGNLALEIVLNESDDYGTIKAIVNAPIGTVIVDESTFDQRTMWSSRNKTPIFLLIFPNLLIFGIWGLIVYLFINLFKLSKS
ncbi:MAG: hypothetical protein KAH67_02645 [Flavobacteriaceae bacterium]|nr:hypothetical protein [Flavobacteriaceae bacterium]